MEYVNVKIEIDTCNDAFRENPGAEVARILRNAADKIEYGSEIDFPLRDENGNTVGQVSFEI
jgi:hypothetical protein